MHVVALAVALLELDFEIRAHVPHDRLHPGQVPVGERAGRTFAAVDRYFPSTRLCSACGVLTGPKGPEGLKVRAWACGCGAVHDRDANAEINIRREGKRMVAEGHAETSNACGGLVRPGRPGAAR
ncbi:zinc ribbon domain-containing protein [Glycomyces albidus]|uniref:zinc ribbon domain-containing protein n=1 Tax=Glycomyces albidus TaxID=2656774 RepID=UPI002AD3033E|nr:zinc ribbon domain-containing protein [Glycomyces albidus]